MLAKLKSLLVKDWIQTSYEKEPTAGGKFHFGLWRKTMHRVTKKVRIKLKRSWSLKR